MDRFPAFRSLYASACFSSVVGFLEGFAGVLIGIGPSRDADGIAGFVKIQRCVLV